MIPTEKPPRPAIKADLSQLNEKGLCWRYYRTPEQVKEVEARDPTWALRALADYVEKLQKEMKGRR